MTEPEGSTSTWEYADKATLARTPPPKVGDNYHSQTHDRTGIIKEVKQYGLTFIFYYDWCD